MIYSVKAAFSIGRNNSINQWKTFSWNNVSGPRFGRKGNALKIEVQRQA
jgi:hypothetical protein